MSEETREKIVVKEGVVLDENDRPIGPDPETNSQHRPFSGSRPGFQHHATVPLRSVLTRAVVVLGVVALFSFGLIVAALLLGITVVFFFFRWLLRR